MSIRWVHPQVFAREANRVINAFSGAGSSGVYFSSLEDAELFKAWSKKEPLRYIWTESSARHGAIKIKPHWDYFTIVVHETVSPGALVLREWLDNRMRIESSEIRFYEPIPDLLLSLGEIEDV